MTENTLTSTDSTATTFIRPIKDALSSAINYVLAGFFITIALSLLALLPGSFGSHALDILEKFTEHAVPSPTPFVPGFFFLGISMAFAPSELAGFIRNRIAHPISDLAAHSVAVAFGVLLALILSALFHADVRPALGSLVGAMVIAFALYSELSLIVLYAEGKVDSVFVDNKFARRTLSVVGIGVAVFAGQQLVSDLSATKPAKPEVCAKQPSQASPSIKASR